jgi:hypothetical protein
MRSPIRVLVIMVLEQAKVLNFGVESHGPLLCRVFGPIQLFFVSTPALINCLGSLTKSLPEEEQCCYGKSGM